MMPIFSYDLYLMLFLKVFIPTLCYSELNMREIVLAVHAGRRLRHPIIVQSSSCQQLGHQP